MKFDKYDNDSLINFYIEKSLIEKAIGELEKPVYIISKVDEFYLKNGFVYSNEELIDKECKACNEYNITCFPKVVVYR